MERAGALQTAKRVLSRIEHIQKAVFVPPLLVYNTQTLVHGQKCVADKQEDGLLRADLDARADNGRQVSNSKRGGHKQAVRVQLRQVAAGQALTHDLRVLMLQMTRCRAKTYWYAVWVKLSQAVCLAPPLGHVVLLSEGP